MNTTMKAFAAVCFVLISGLVVFIGCFFGCGLCVGDLTHNLHSYSPFSLCVVPQCTPVFLVSHLTGLNV